MLIEIYCQLRNDRRVANCGHPRKKKFFAEDLAKKEKTAIIVV
jgi:hypothetical protein